MTITVCENKMIQSEIPLSLDSANKQAEIGVFLCYIVRVRGYYFEKTKTEMPYLFVIIYRLVRRHLYITLNT